jgi:hypothetical protein
MERDVLGAYYPEGTYMTPADFDISHGCGGHGDSIRANDDSPTRALGH